MNMWAVILAGLLFVTLGNALEDAGVYVNGTYSQGKLERRVLPPTVVVCALNNNATEWWRFNVWEQVLKNFESSNIIRKATLRLGTPGLHFLGVDQVEFRHYQYCRYLPKAYQKDTLTSTGVRKVNLTYPYEYLAVKLNNTERATVKQGWTDLINLIKNQFPSLNVAKRYFVFVEIAASGQAYVGAFQKFL